MPEIQRITLNKAIEFARDQVCENQNNAELIQNFTKIYLKDLKKLGLDKNKKPEELILNGAIIGYALRYLDDQGVLKVPKTKKKE